MLIRSSVLAVNTCLTSAGSPTMTVRPKTGMLIVNPCPERRAASRSTPTRAAAKPTPWITFGRGTTGGSFAATSTADGLDKLLIDHSQRERGTTQYRGVM